MNRALTLLIAILAAAPAPAGPAGEPPSGEPPSGEKPESVRPPGSTAPRKAPVTDRAYLGIQMDPARPGQTPEGVRVSYVLPHSAAQEIGLRFGDEVLEFNGQAVPDRASLSRELVKQDIGAAVKFGIRREGQAMELRGALGSFQKTRAAYLAQCRQEAYGKPFAPPAEIVWDGADGVKALRGKIAVVVCIDDCQECVGAKWMRARSMEETLRKVGSGLDWMGFAGIFSKFGEPYEKNREARDKILARYPAPFPVGVARDPAAAPGGVKPRDPLLMDHGVVLLDPDGKVLYLELGSADLMSPNGEFSQALQEAAKKYGPKTKAGGPKPAAPPPRG